MYCPELAWAYAIRDFQDSLWSSERHAAQASEIPRSPRGTRMNGHQSRPTSHQQQQRLTPLQETVIAEWILDEYSRGERCTRTEVRGLATRLLRTNGDFKPLGRSWTAEFIARHPRVAAVWGGRSKTTQTIVAAPETIRTPPPASSPPDPLTPSTSSPSSLVFNTPRSSRDFYEAQQKLRQSVTLTRSERLACRVLAKTLAEAFARVAEAEARLERVEAELESIGITPSRKHFRFNSTEGFSDVDDFEAAIGEAAVRQAEGAVFPLKKEDQEEEEEEEEEEEAGEGLPPSSMCFQWQL